jgi:hypothetical protein
LFKNKFLFLQCREHKLASKVSMQCREHKLAAKVSMKHIFAPVVQISAGTFVGDNGKGQEEDVRTALRSLHIGRF